MKKLLKAELMSELSKTTGMSQTQCDTVMTTFAKLVATKTLDEDTTVTIQGLGTFSPNFKKARTGRNPQTGAVLEIQAKTVIKFKAVGSLVKQG